ncbi:MAG: hypothetical protein J3Q66DRAFT_28905 [Benniella sp.]|nr:MAG: hypothetical protein J3Q66DRAFT_28905 [Benniella sp.]
MSTGPPPFLLRRSHRSHSNKGDTPPEQLSDTPATPVIESTPVAPHPTWHHTKDNPGASTTECTTTMMPSPANTPAPMTSDAVATTDPGPQPTSPATTASEMDRTTTARDDTTTPQVTDATTAVIATVTTPRVIQTSDTTVEPSLPPTTVPATTPFTTRYITKVSVITVTAVIPKTTMISGRGTTMYVTGVTTKPTATVIPDPNQEPPPGTSIDSNHGGGLKTWQLILIVVACLVVAMAVGAVCLVGWIKKRRRHFQQQQMKQRESLYHMRNDRFGSASPGNNSNHFNNSGSGESVQGSELTDSIDRTLIAQTPAGGRWSAWFNRLVRPRSSRNSFNHQFYPQGHGSPGGLWLTEDGRENPSYEGSIAAVAALYPVSYLNNPSSGMIHQQQPQQSSYLPYLATPTGIEDEFFAASAMEPSATPPQMTELHHAHNHLQEDILSLNTGVATASPSVMAGESEGNSHYPNPPLSAPLSSPYTSRSLTHPSVGGTYGGDNGASVMSSPNLMRLSVSTSSQAQSRHLSQDRDSLAVTSQRESHDWTRSSGLSDHTGNYRDTILTDPRSTLVVDPEQLESNAVFEHIRKDPQALPGLLSPSIRSSERSGTGTDMGTQGKTATRSASRSGLSGKTAAVNRMVDEDEGAGVGSLRSGRLNREP